MRFLYKYLELESWETHFVMWTTTNKMTQVQSKPSGIRIVWGNRDWNKSKQRKIMVEEGPRAGKSRDRMPPGGKDQTEGALSYSPPCHSWPACARRQLLSSCHSHTQMLNLYPSVHSKDRLAFARGCIRVVHKGTFLFPFSAKWRVRSLIGHDFPPFSQAETLLLAHCWH